LEREHLEDLDRDGRYLNELLKRNLHDSRDRGNKLLGSSECSELIDQPRN